MSPSTAVLASVEEEVGDHAAAGAVVVRCEYLRD